MQRFSSTIWRRTGLDSHISLISGSDTQIWRQPLKKGPATTTILLFLFILLATALLSSSWINSSTFSVTNVTEKATTIPKGNRRSAKRIEIPLNCSAGNLTQTCPVNYPTSFETEDQDPSLNSTCPDYFRWIHEDLRAFASTGITRDMVERAKRTAHFRVVIVKGKVYVEKYKKSIQTRDVFTLWGILQLLRRYPGRLPDLELMFDCNDRPVIRLRDYRGPNATAPPPLFRYCGDRWNLDIVFPDWSFWGWAEINIKPWESILKEIKEGNSRTKWMERETYAYWKGNPFVAETRRDLLKCNVSGEQDWNARLFVQDWILESQQGYKQSDLASQCTYRYKIYIEGYAWSVSEKYILACDSVTLLVKPHYYDFFMRSLQPVHHYWPIRDDDKCRSIKFAVDWGNNHKQKAQAIGKAAGDFIQEELKMDYVYDYMFHLLNEYAKLLKFEPKVPEGAEEFCSETMACPADGIEKRFMMESLVKGPSITSPCTIPPPYDPRTLGAFVKRKVNSIKQVETWERRYWDSLNKQQ
uniref:Glycosyl transferase CAP10 domain-containing protein n=1 Tax=Davidia involucrata TaxID=16924 RepID=A0A5B7BT47_DAVIN